MEVVCVMDLSTPEGLKSRTLAYEAIHKACTSLNAKFVLASFEKLDFGETNVLDLFYNADVCIVDISVQVCHH